MPTDVNTFHQSTCVSLKRAKLVGAWYPSHLYVTPLDESARTLCLFFLGPWLEASSSLEPLDLESDLYTVAIVSMSINACWGIEISSRVAECQD